MVETSHADAALLARMATAVRVLREAGLEIDTGDDRDSLLRRAIQWDRYSRGPVPDRQRACAVDLARGSLRLWSLAGGVPRRLPDRLARVRLSTLVRTRCAALRADLAAEAAVLTRRGVVTFEDRVRREVLRVFLEVDAAAAELGLSTGSASPHLCAPRRQVEELLPPRRRPRLENRLTTLLGVGFGTGLSLTVGRLVALVCPGWATVVGCGLVGLALTTWTVLARCLLAERSAAERWILEVVANLRPVLEERLVCRILVAGSAAEEVRPSR